LERQIYLPWLMFHFQVNDIKSLTIALPKSGFRLQIRFCYIALKLWAQQENQTKDIWESVSRKKSAFLIILLQAHTRFFIRNILGKIFRSEGATQT
jgi:hypothetical protein